MIVRKQQIVLGGYDARQYRHGTIVGDGQRRRSRAGLGRGARRPRGRWVTTATLRAVAPSPFVLYGYGSYEISIDPSFSSLRLSLLERGVIFAIAHVRGGGEMGRSPGTRWGNSPRSPRPSATSSRSRAP
jgi:oligopeptidase B